MSELQNPLIALYGVNVYELILEEINKLKSNSNITFDNEYIKLGVGFISIKATEMYEQKRKYSSLSNLVSESFGEAAIYKYNVMGED